MAQHALVLGPSGHVQSDPTVPAKSGDSTIQPDLHRNLSNLNLHCLAPRATAIKEQGSLSQWQHELRLLKADQPDPSLRQSGPFSQSDASVISWTSGHRL